MIKIQKYRNLFYIIQNKEEVEKLKFSNQFDIDKRGFKSFFKSNNFNTQ